jgi:hypothetical protein
MKYLSFLLALLCIAQTLFAQKVVYTINADSTKLTGCDSNELIIENHTQNVPGFLFNTGKGRTIFKKGLIKVNDSVYVIGGDTLRSNPWLQGGNRFGATGILGTLDNNHLDVYTNNARRLRLTNTGKLLIGTTTDNTLNDVQVNGSVFGNMFTNIPVAVGGPSGPTGAIRLRWGTGDGGYIGFYFQNKVNRRAYIASAADGRNLIIEDSVGISFKGTPVINIGTEFGMANSARLSIANDTSSGKDAINVGHRFADGSQVMDLAVKPGGNLILGVGVDSGSRFQVHGTSYFSSNVGIGTTSASAQLHTTGTVRFAGLAEDSTQTRVLVSDASGNLYYRSAASLAANDILRSSLAVNGTIKARELKLFQAGWADYVFDSTYSLMPLKEVNEYIHARRHLPGIPSAAEVARNGADVGETQVALLKKIEELTLYNIQQEEKIDGLNKKIELLMEKVASMEKKK